jgi:putative ABC transport system permease protein
LGMHQLDGRTFTERDTAESTRVVVINERLARLRFGNENPIGRLARVGVSTQTPFEIVGVVADDRHLGVDADPTPTFFLPYRQTPNARELALIARGQGASAQLVSGLRGAIRAADPEMPFYQVQTMEQIVDASVATPRSLAWLLSSFALSGLILAAIGVFGVLSHAVTQRTQEIGVRMAIGASPTQVLRQVMSEGLIQVTIGIVVGTALALATSRLLAGLLFGVTAADPVAYVGVAALLTTVAVAASLAPARRAMRVDPITALRAD